MNNVYLASVTKNVTIKVTKLVLKFCCQVADKVLGRFINQRKASDMTTYKKQHLTSKHLELIEEIKSYEIREYASDSEVLDKALELLCKSEKTLAYQQLGAAMKKHYEENPQEIEFMARIQGI